MTLTGPSPGRYSVTRREKSEGATYTPPSFASFAAAKILSVAVLPEDGPIRILDPACGDGALLLALLKALSEPLRKRAIVHGFDINLTAVETTRRVLSREFPEAELLVECCSYQDSHDAQTECSGTPRASGRYDLIIANPPYVRAQILGAKQASVLAVRYGLTGRVDLYFAFLLALTEALSSHGVAGIIVSNRFMTTRAGRTVRSSMRSRWKLRHAWDLGDTKLFESAVLPAFLLASGKATRTNDDVLFSSIYQTDEGATVQVDEPFAALQAPSGAIVEVLDGRKFRIQHGRIAGERLDEVWCISNSSSDAWLASVNARTWATFRKIGKIRVGVKTTADSVFIRSDWNAMPQDRRPELLQPLLNRQSARPFRAVDEKSSLMILYPHETTPRGRAAVELSLYPKTAAYLEAHRSRLTARRYVIDGGRRWYEIWVPHDPSGWKEPKLVFPDISEKPTFWLDTSAAIVNGDCYWLRCENGADPDWLWLALAVANSDFIEAFYDRRFNNKLYAGRRRFITQYVEHFPLPDPGTEIAGQMITLAKFIYRSLPSDKAVAASQQLNQLVWMAFGLPVKEAGSRTPA